MLPDFSSPPPRRGQRPFREKLLLAYERKCAITGCSVEEALDAAHILSWQQVGMGVQSGVLLRADLHRLFGWKDGAWKQGVWKPGAGPFLTITETWLVQVAPKLLETEYGKWDGMPFRRPSDETCHPDKKMLDKHRAKFLAVHQLGVVK